MSVSFVLAAIFLCLFNGMPGAGCEHLIGWERSWAWICVVFSHCFSSVHIFLAVVQAVHMGSRPFLQVQAPIPSSWHQKPTLCPLLAASTKDNIELNSPLLSARRHHLSSSQCGIRMVKALFPLWDNAECHHSSRTAGGGYWGLDGISSWSFPLYECWCWEHCPTNGHSLLQLKRSLPESPR